MVLIFDLDDLNLGGSHWKMKYVLPENHIKRPQAMIVSVEWRSVPGFWRKPHRGQPKCQRFVFSNCHVVINVLYYKQSHQILILVSKGGSLTFSLFFSPDRRLKYRPDRRLALEHHPKENPNRQLLLGSFLFLYYSNLYIWSLEIAISVEKWLIYVKIGKIHILICVRHRGTCPSTSKIMCEPT